MKRLFYWLLLIIFPGLLFAQVQDSSFLKDSLAIKKDSVKKDTLLKKDSAILPTQIKKTPVHAKSYFDIVATSLAENKFVNIKGVPEASKEILKKRTPQDFVFYLLLTVTFFLAFLRLFYARYFQNLFQVFFNTSLRQNQLTDQLLQSKQASLFFNIFFVITSGVYSYFLIRHYYAVKPSETNFIILCCIACLTVIYIGKFIVLKFTGWLTGYKEITNTYLFVIFLINKMTAILLLPLVFILAFSDPALANTAILVSLVLLLVLLFLRFFRSYGLLQNKLKVSRFHFFIYIIGTEALPLLLIYKVLMILLIKNL
ncbi:DUF4271 domain-containing protein [Ferruginibacter albus]|uniref:DUF4271 domain-containing protein n=1 Tax=Ferruginibacter albus TaxID=2875540 RepID=UPI001CC7B6AB|nr:DUF4271 domain-containing protein [Ferruginibacter albus]UAY51708.1 DUF4271 domain-containing protein [Ferruginibacter albus]